MLAKERWQTFENSWKNTIFNEYPVDCFTGGTQIFLILTIKRRVCPSISMTLFAILPEKDLSLSWWVSITDSFPYNRMENIEKIKPAFSEDTVKVYTHLPSWDLCTMLLVIPTEARKFSSPFESENIFRTPCNLHPKPIILAGWVLLVPFAEGKY